MRLRMTGIAVVPAVLILAAAGSGCVTTEGGQQINLLSTEQEIELGNKLAAEVEKDETILENPAIQQYVSEIGTRLARQSPRQDVPYSFKVIDNPEVVNAFALPGGRMYLYTGLLVLCDNEAQLASVMAHEIAHVAGRHHGEALTRQHLFDLVQQVVFGKNPSQTAQVIDRLLPIVTVLPFSRAQEREADRLGLDFLWRAGYRPEAMVDFMAKLMAHEQIQGAGPRLRFLSSHPATPDRIQQLAALIEQFPPNLRERSQLNAERYETTVLKGLGVTIRQADR